MRRGRSHKSRIYESPQLRLINLLFSHSQILENIRMLILSDDRRKIVTIGFSGRKNLLSGCRAVLRRARSTTVMLLYKMESKKCYLAGGLIFSEDSRRESSDFVTYNRHQGKLDVYSSIPYKKLTLILL